MKWRLQCKQNVNVLYTKEHYTLFSRTFGQNVGLNKLLCCGSYLQCGLSLCRILDSLHPVTFIYCHLVVTFGFLCIFCCFLSLGLVVRALPLLLLSIKQCLCIAVNSWLWNRSVPDPCHIRARSVSQTAAIRAAKGLLDSLVEQGLSSGSSGQAHAKLLVLAKHRCVQPPLFTPQWLVPMDEGARE